VVGPTTEPVLGTAYSYRHALLRDAGYASLARAERARLHVRLARWLEGAAGERAPEVAEQIAGHYAAALDSAPALAREIDGLDRDAVRKLAADWYERAGQGTLALSAHDAARQLLRRSIDLTGDDQRLEQARRWERLGDATAFAADMDEGGAAYQKAIDLYRAAMGAIERGFDLGANTLEGAGQMMLEKLGPLASVSPEAAAALERGAREMSEGARELRAGGRELRDSLAEARAGLARTTAARAKVMYQQLRFAEAEKLAADTHRELADADDLSLARLDVAEAMSALGARGPEPDTERRIAGALEVARRSSDPRTELEALNALTVLRAETGRNDPRAWQELRAAAGRLGDWARVISATTNEVVFQLDDHARDMFDLIEEARQTALAHGLTENAGWNDYLAAEAAFVTGDWERALASGLRAIDVGEANAYLRLTVRTIHVVVPISSVRGDRATLERVGRWYRSIEDKFEFPDSPYSRVVRPAQDLELAANGLWPAYVPEVGPRIASFRDDPSGPSWSAALDRVFRAWLEAGEVEGAGRALATLTDAMPRHAGVSSLGRGTYELLRGRLYLARGDNEAAAAAGNAALDAFRISDAPWWMAKAIRLLERAGAADYGLLAEVLEIERALGAIAPTA
jgi:hypothetical protein